MSRQTNRGALELPQFIIITGQEGSGKDSYGDHLATQDYMHVSAGDVLRSRARMQGFTDPIPREVLSKIGDELKQEFGPSPIVKSMIAEYERQQENFPSGLVISGLRRVGELMAFKDYGAVQIWIAADDNQRFTNQSQRGRGDKQDREAFLERSKKEYYGDIDGGGDGVNLQAIEALADCVVTNDGGLEDLFRNADEALGQYHQTN